MTTTPLFIRADAFILRILMRKVANRNCIVIPHYEHHHQLESFLPELTQLGYPVIVVDDGSGDVSYANLQSLAARLQKIEVLSHEQNQGKGAAVQTGFRHALKSGYTHAVQIDADGQHAIKDVPRMLHLMQVSPQAVVTGLPIFDQSMPAVRRYGKKLTDWWVYLQTLSFAIADSMCGFRGYPLICAVRIMDTHSIGKGMDFDVEFIVHAYWAGVPIRYMPTKVNYPADGVSHFHYLRDNLLITRMHFRLVLGMLLRLPDLLTRRNP